MNVPEVLRISNEKGKRALLYDDALSAQLPHLEGSFKHVDNEYTDLLKDHNELGGYQFEISGIDPNGPVAEASVICNEKTAKSSQMLVIFSPFNDVAPKSCALDIKKFALTENPSKIQKQIAKPHSWNQTTKSRTIHDLLEAEDLAMPVVTIFSPIPQGVYKESQLQDFRHGNFRGANYLADKAIRGAKDIIGEKFGPVKVEGIHLYGASLGASNVAGVAEEKMRTKAKTPELLSATLQELILGPKHIPDLADKFLLHSRVGEETKTPAPRGSRIKEPLMRLDLDGKGNEIGVTSRIVRGMLKQAYLKGLTRPGNNTIALWNLADSGIPTTVAVAANSGVSQNTMSTLSNHHKINEIIVKGLEGHKIDHLVNEHVAASATIALLGIKKSIRK